MIRANGLLLVCSLIVCACHSFVPKPSTIDDACMIVNHHQTWREALQQAQLKSSVPVELILAIIRQESSFRADIRPPMKYVLGVIPIGRASSAYGYAQVIDSTWQWYQKSNHAWQHRRDRFADAVDFIIWYVRLTHERYHVDYHDYRLHYLAYHEGHGGFKRKSYRHKKKLLKYAQTVVKWSKQFLSDLENCGLDEAP